MNSSSLQKHDKKKENVINTIQTRTSIFNDRGWSAGKEKINISIHPKEEEMWLVNENIDLENLIFGQPTRN